MYAAGGNPEAFIEDHLDRLPVGLRVSSESPMKLALFLTTLRSFSEQAAPGLLAWETKNYEGTSYVVIRTPEDSALGVDINIYYAARPDAFLLSLNEDLLKRAIARNVNREKTAEDEASGKQVFAQTKLSALRTYLALEASDTGIQQQFSSWAALPILNEWRATFPKIDPVQTQANYFKETIRCPGGKGYQWNEALGSMESVAFGHPEAPREGFVDIPILEDWDEAKAAIELKDNEFRLEATLTK